MEKKALISAKDLQRPPFELSRCMSYKLLNNPELPVVRIGRNKYLLSAQFDEWLLSQAKHGETEN